MKTILTVCKGNIHRSVIAALCIEKQLQKLGLASEYNVISRGLQGSAGTDPPEHPNLMCYSNEWSLTAPVLEEIGIEIPDNQTATPVTEEVVRNASFILVMEHRVLHGSPISLIKQFPAFGFKMMLFLGLAGSTDDIPDCYGSKAAELFREVALTINSTVQNHIVILLQLTNFFSTHE